MKSCLPIIGHVKRSMSYVNFKETKQVMIRHFVNDDFKNRDLAKLYVFFGTHYPVIFISDPYLIEDVFVKNNKYISKAGVTKNLVYPLMGESILL